MMNEVSFIKEGILFLVDHELALDVYMYLHKIELPRKEHTQSREFLGFSGYTCCGRERMDKSTVS